MFNYIYGIFAIGVLNLWSIIYLDNIHKEISQIIMYKTHIGECHQIESFDLIKLTKLNGSSIKTIITFDMHLKS